MKSKQTCIVINQRLCAPFLHLKSANETKRLGQEIKGKKQTSNLVFSIKFKIQPKILTNKIHHQNFSTNQINK